MATGTATATPKQTKISSFFSSSSSSSSANGKKKRSEEEERENKQVEEENPEKKLKLEKEKNGKSVGNESEGKENKSEAEAEEETKGEEEKEAKAATPLSPEAKAKIENNKMAAKLKLLSSKTCGLVTNFGPSWISTLDAEFGKDYFAKLAKFVAAERESKTVYPPASEVFCWTRLCPMDQIKVVILGQDPYHGPNQAHGLCFSVQKGVPPPPSLVNMYKELETDVEEFERPNHGYLGGWAEQGVLLLNACLTVRKGEANSHKDKGWETFTDAVIKTLSKTRPPGLVFILWGSYAQKKGSVIDRKRPGHYVLSGPHPSPLSAHRGFFGCKHFSKANELLKKEGKKPIDWNHLPLP